MAAALNTPSLRSLSPFSGCHGMNGGLIPLCNLPFIDSPPPTLPDLRSKEKGKLLFDF